MKVNKDCKKVSTKEELIELLKKYKGILSDSMISYLNSLIDLEFSVVREYISNNDKEALSELEVYRKIAIYNIYNRALNIFKQKESELIISSNNEGIEGLNIYASLGENNCKLFDFNYMEVLKPYGYKAVRIGDISLFKTIESTEKREEELIRVMNELDRLYDEKNPYNSSHNVYGGPASQWAFEHSKKIKDYEDKFNLLDSKKELTDEDKKEIEITKRFNELLLEDYGLTNKDFEESNYKCFFNDKTKLQKTLVKKIPNINIKNNIKYI